MAHTIMEKYSEVGWAGNFEPHPYLIDGIPATEAEVAERGLAHIVTLRDTDNESVSTPPSATAFEVTDSRLQDVTDPAALLG